VRPLRRGAAIREPRAIEHVVGIGASAGGLEALQNLASHLVAGGGVSYVVAQHLAPEHRSLIVDLLAHATELTVVTARDGALLLPNVIAIAPPNHDVAVEGDRLKLSDPLPRFGPSPSIDLLFESIAEHWGERGVAVVLSGTGSDGAQGVRAVRVAGGLTLAQAPESAKFDAMPRAAISLGGADLVLDPAAIGERLAELIAAGGPWSGGSHPALEPVRLEAVTGQLKHITGIDFSQYKESTLRRQLQRRMAIRQVGSLEAYLPLLSAEPEEAQALVQNLLVTVTEFFRDPQAFDALREVLRELVEQRGSGERLRVWIPGCATGKEVYSIAMVISEVLGHPADLAAHLKIFGTDLDEPSLMIGRRAIYPIAAAQAIPDDLRRRFVIERGEEMEISEVLRNCAVFARHDVGADPPFPSLDLISCRNTLIYFTQPMQERVLGLFRFGLLPGGLLFLGSSESLGHRTMGFTVANAEHRLFRRTREEANRQRSPLPNPSARQPLPITPASRIAVLRETVPEQHMALLEGLIRATCPPALVLDENHDLVEVIGDVTPFCRLPEGRMSAAAHAFLLPELQSEARALFLLARADGNAVGSQAIKLAEGDRSVRLEAFCIKVGERAFTVLAFAPPGQAAPAVPSESLTTTRDAAFDREIERLERELLTSQDSLRRSLAQLEQANEELEASSEELQASSEELQSSNEELEASNEELQATNDELGTLNGQLRARSDELEQLNMDLENIQTSLSQGMVIVDPQLRVSRFSPLAVRVFGLLDGDIGQPLLAVPTTVPLPGLREALQAVMGGEPRRSLEAGSEEVSYLVQVLPYLERDGRRRGAIVTLTDVSELVELRHTAEAALDEFAGLTDALDQAVWKWDRSMQQLLYASKRIQSLTGWTPSELCDRPALLDEAVDPADRGRVTAARNQGLGQWSIRYRLNTRDGRQIWVLETARVISEGSQPFVVGTLADVTALQELEDRASELSATFESVFDARSFGVIVLDAQLRVVMANQAFCAMVGFDRESIVGVSSALFAPEAVEGLSVATRAALAGSQPMTIQTLQIKGPQGSLHPVQAEIRAMPQPSARAVITLIVHNPTEPSFPPSGEAGM
jgi:two-component system, chemotaxis family, CheB/CheR fusion protein